MSTELRGWLLDVYAGQAGAVVWLAGEDGGRYRLTQTLPVTFYVGGESNELAKLAAHLRQTPLKFGMVQRRHLFLGTIEVMAIRVQNGARQRALFRSLQQRFPHLDYYNSDLPLPSHYFAATKVFPLAFCQVETNERGEIQAISTQDDRWGLKPRLPELRSMKLEPNESPEKSMPGFLRASLGNHTETFSTKDPGALLHRLSALIDQYDPDIISTRYGDMWLFPYLFSMAKKLNVPFNPNRDKTRGPIRIEESQFESYGHLVHRDQQTWLLGRFHLDPKNSMALNEWTLGSIYETARLSNLPVQTAARRSTGGAFVGMQVAASLAQNILIPIRKQQRERFKKGTQLIAADNGGIILKPVTGLHINVAELDFFSMYPNIMTRWNISAETVGEAGKETLIAPGIDVPISQDQRGIVAQVLKPIMAKRRAIKFILEGEGGNKEEYDLEYLQTASNFLKGLGWVSYGYQGFSGNRIGSIEAHEAINAISREVIMQSKEIAEEAGFDVLHMYVDSLFMTIGDQEDNLKKLTEDIQQATGLKIDIEGIFNWIVFLPSKQDPNVPVPNCFYGAFRTGKIKCRGIMARRDDTPRYIHDVQMTAIHYMAKKTSLAELRASIPRLVGWFRLNYRKIMEGRVSLNDLSITQRLSRNLEDFKVLSPAGRAAMQLAKDHKVLSAGQTISYVRVKEEPRALSLHAVKDGTEIDKQWYCEQLLRAADEILQPLGVPKTVLANWLAGQPGYWIPEQYVVTPPRELPILEHIARHPVLNSVYQPA